MSTQSGTRRPWLATLLVALTGYLIVLAAWQSQDRATARFFLGVLVGLSTAVLAAAVIEYVGERRHR